jgi:hypothetical protein
MAKCIAFSSAVSLLVGCGNGDVTAPSTGALEIRASTSSLSALPSGYEIVVDGRTRSTLPANGSITVGNLAEGDHTVRLDGLPADCGIGGTNPTSVTIFAGGTARVTFQVSCGPGLLLVRTTTVGQAIDPDGYGVMIDNSLEGSPIEVNGSTQVPGLVAGNHQVLLVGVAPNCEVAGNNPRWVTVTTTTLAQTEFTVECGPPSGGIELMLFQRGSTFPRYHLYRMWPDGSEILDLTSDSDGQEGQWSPDRQRIVFTSYRDGNPEIYLMKPDGSGVTRLTQNAADDTQPTWSPDGTKIAFVSTRNDGSNVYLMNADGTGVTSITGISGGFEPSWSPDGTRIAFSRVTRLCRFDVCAADVFVIPAGGGVASNLTRNAGGTAYQPAWSPDGTWIAYDQDRQIFLIRPDGSGRTNLSQDPANQDVAPVWAPDGTRLAFTRSFMSSDIFVMNADGSGAASIGDTHLSGKVTSWR